MPTDKAKPAISPRLSKKLQDEIVAAQTEMSAAPPVLPEGFGADTTAVQPPAAASPQPSAVPDQLARGKLAAAELYNWLFLGLVAIIGVVRILTFSLTIGSRHDILPYILWVPIVAAFVTLVIKNIGAVQAVRDRNLGIKSRFLLSAVALLLALVLYGAINAAATW